MRVFVNALPDVPTEDNLVECLPTTEFMEAWLRDIMDEESGNRYAFYGCPEPKPNTRYFWAQRIYNLNGFCPL